MKELNERTRKVLWAIIQSYIDLNVPVGSFMVKRRFSFGLSPATIRSTMAGLESLGYLTQPHTSAGRIPTMMGYRYYVDNLLKKDKMNINKVLLHKLHRRLRGIQKNLNVMVNETSRTLSQYSKCIGIVTPPKAEEKVLKHIRLIKYEKNRALSILISEDGTINNNMITLDSSYTQRQLKKITNYLNDTFAGLTMMEIKQRIVYQLSREKQACNRLISNALMLCKELIIWESDNILLEGLTGTSNLPDFVDMKQIKEVLKTIEDKQLMLKLLDEVDDSKGIKVFVGLDSIVPSMKKMSMVISPYTDKKNARGTMGIIGPASMDYRHLIPIVDHTARALSLVLSET